MKRREFITLLGGAAVLEHRAEIEKQLKRMSGAISTRGRASLLRGRKVPPKYRSPLGELSAFTDEFAKVRLRDGHGEKAHRHSHWWRRRPRPQRRHKNRYLPQ
jgi:hypothetical protein